MNKDFSRDVHGYLGEFVNVADTKIGVLTTLALAILGALAQDGASQPGAETCLRWAGIMLESVSVGAGAFALYPRLTSGGRSLVFWEDIRNYKPDEYLRLVDQLNDEAAERQFALQNFYISGVLHRKYKCIRIGLAFFIAGAVAALLRLLIGTDHA